MAQSTDPSIDPSIPSVQPLPPFPEGQSAQVDFLQHEYWKLSQTFASLVQKQSQLQAWQNQLVTWQANLEQQQQRQTGPVRGRGIRYRGSRGGVGGRRGWVEPPILVDQNHEQPPKPEN